MMDSPSGERSGVPGPRMQVLGECCGQWGTPSKRELFRCGSCAQRNDRRRRTNSCRGSDVRKLLLEHNLSRGPNLRRRLKVLTSQIRIVSSSENANQERAGRNRKSSPSPIPSEAGQDSTSTGARVKVNATSRMASDDGSMMANRKHST